jgi:hypothetical protein
MQDVDVKSEVLSLAKNKLSKALKGVTRKNNQAKKIKHNKRKAEKRKAKRLEKSTAFLKSKLIGANSQDNIEDGCIITKDMLQMEELERLRRDRHSTALTKILETYNWHPDAKKCVLVKLTGWALDKERDSKEEEEKEEDELDEDNEEHGEDELDEEDESEVEMVELE